MTSAMPVLPQTRLAGWLLFFIFSLLLHLLLLLWPVRHFSLAEQMSETHLAVTLVSNSTAPATSAVPAAHQHSRHHSAPAPHRPPAETVPAKAVRSEPPPPAEAQSTDAAKPTVTASLQMPYAERRYSGYSSQMNPSFGQEMLMGPPPEAVDAASENISSQIRTRFSEHFSYPLLAQRNGWEGEVILAFRVESDGSLTNIRVQQSSGHALLDESAINSLRAIERVEFNNGLQLRHSLELRMPVVYHLKQR